MSDVKRIYVEKKPGFDVAAQHLYTELKEQVGIKNLEGVRLLIRYDIQGISSVDYTNARNTIFAEPPVDFVYDEQFKLGEHEHAIATEYLPGQYDQRADSAAQCIQILSHKAAPLVKTAQVIIVKGVLAANDMDAITKFLINPVDSHKAALEKPKTLEDTIASPADVKTVRGFITMPQPELIKLRADLGLAMSDADILFCRDHFANQEKRDPSLTEIRMLDTYWSDHCRHTTFLTKINKVTIEKNLLTTAISQAHDAYKESREYVYGTTERPSCLMDIATIGMKELRKKGLLDDVELSDEINACSIIVDATINAKKEEWLVMFKNETHNHPTEIEPFGGAATCIGGAIRDPLSGRTYVYQAMRITGSGDPRKTPAQTLSGKLTQRKITTEAAHGYSSYGNQIGLTTGVVSEIYHEGFIAKRMELGAVIAAGPRAYVKREKPVPGDVIILVGGRTGRDGCGGATGSSKAHTQESITACGAEVQKGNAPTERKIQRLFRNPDVSVMIKKCNDFGAGGVSVAIGELADGLLIDLDAVPKKYEGLDGTELAISESQERMAVLIDKKDVDAFLRFTQEENLEATQVAVVTEAPRVVMQWRGKTIVNLSRDFINTNGVLQETDVEVTAPDVSNNYFNQTVPEIAQTTVKLEQTWLNNLTNLNVCSQKGLVERFDSTIGAASVILPFGGKYQLTPTQSMVAKLPVRYGDTITGTIMSHGYNAELSSWSPFHGALYAIIDAMAKIAAAGGDNKRTRLSLQEYFEKLGKDPLRWGKPFAALLGAYYAQKMLGIGAIGGKDSMSGTFEDIHVPPTLVAFAVCPTDVNTTISPEFKKVDNYVVYVPLAKNKKALPQFAAIKKQYALVHKLIKSKKIVSAYAVNYGGVAAALTKMCFGNRIGMQCFAPMDRELLFTAQIGSLICEVTAPFKPEDLFTGVEHVLLGKTIDEPIIKVNGVTVSLDDALDAWKKPLEAIFPSNKETDAPKPLSALYTTRSTVRPAVKIATPRVFIPVFPGTNCEYDSAKAFERAGAIVDCFVFRNLTATDVDYSVAQMTQRINNAQIIMIPGGFSAGDEPDGSGKFIAAVFRNSQIKDAVHNLLKKRDGLMLGVCNGFQAIIKLGLVPYGEIRDMTENSPTLTFNTIGRHVSRMVNTKVTSVLSPWFSLVSPGDRHTIAISHGEGRFVASDAEMETLISNGQVATQYVDFEGNPSATSQFNPNGSMNAIEGITSPDGRVLGKMAHSERVGTNIHKNIMGLKDQRIFEAGVGYFK